MRIVDPATWPLHPIGNLIAVSTDQPDARSGACILVAIGDKTTNITRGDAGRTALT